MGMLVAESSASQTEFVHMARIGRIEGFQIGTFFNKLLDSLPGKMMKCVFEFVPRIVLRRQLLDSLYCFPSFVEVSYWGECY